MTESVTAPSASSTVLQGRWADAVDDFYPDGSDDDVYEPFPSFSERLSGSLSSARPVAVASASVLAVDPSNAAQYHRGGRRRGGRGGGSGWEGGTGRWQSSGRQDVRYDGRQDARCDGRQDVRYPSGGASRGNAQKQKPPFLLVVSDLPENFSEVDVKNIFPMPAAILDVALHNGVAEVEFSRFDFMMIGLKDHAQSNEYTGHRHIHVEKRQSAGRSFSRSGGLMRKKQHERDPPLKACDDLVSNRSRRVYDFQKCRELLEDDSECRPASIFGIGKPRPLQIASVSPSHAASPIEKQDSGTHSTAIPAVDTAASKKKENPFGDAKPRDEAEVERRKEDERRRQHEFEQGAASQCRECEVDRHGNDWAGSNEHFEKYSGPLVASQNASEDFRLTDGVLQAHNATRQEAAPQRKSDSAVPEKGRGAHGWTRTRASNSKVTSSRSNVANDAAQSAKTPVTPHTAVQEGARRGKALCLSNAAVQPSASNLPRRVDSDQQSSREHRRNADDSHAQSSKNSNYTVSNRDTHANRLDVHNEHGGRINNEHGGRINNEHGGRINNEHGGRINNGGRAGGHRAGRDFRGGRQHGNMNNTTHSVQKAKMDQGGRRQGSSYQTGNRNHDEIAEMLTQPSSEKYTEKRGSRKCVEFERTTSSKQDERTIKRWDYQVEGHDQALSREESATFITANEASRDFDEEECGPIRSSNEFTVFASAVEFMSGGSYEEASLRRNSTKFRGGKMRSELCGSGGFNQDNGEHVAWGTYKADEEVHRGRGPGDSKHNSRHRAQAKWHQTRGTRNSTEGNCLGSRDQNKEPASEGVCDGIVNDPSRPHLNKMHQTIRGKQGRRQKTAKQEHSGGPPTTVGDKGKAAPTNGGTNHSATTLKGSQGLCSTKAKLTTSNPFSILEESD